MFRKNSSEIGTKLARIALGFSSREDKSSIFLQIQSHNQRSSKFEGQLASSSSLESSSIEEVNYLLSNIREISQLAYFDQYLFSYNRAK